jgi:hypothetical protein
LTHEVEVELKPGSYPVSCNVARHKEAGMVATIIVEWGSAFTTSSSVLLDVFISPPYAEGWHKEVSS